MTAGHTFSKISQNIFGAKTVVTQILLVKYTINFEEMAGHT